MRTPWGSRDKLGTFDLVAVKSRFGENFTIVNAYTQYRWSGYEDVFEYNKFEEFLSNFGLYLAGKRECMDRNLRVGLPKIGCGYARGDQLRIISMIEKFAECAKDYANVSLVTLPAR